MSDIYKMPGNFASEALVDKEKYIQMYNNQSKTLFLFGKNRQNVLTGLEIFLGLKMLVMTKITFLLNGLTMEP